MSFEPLERELAKPEPFVTDEEGRRIRERAAVLRIEKAAKRLAMTRGERLQADLIGAAGAAIGLVAALTILVVTCIAAIKVVEWAVSW